MDDRLRSAGRIATIVVIGVLLLLILAEIRVRMNPDSLAVGGMDFATYRAATMSWLAGGPFYPVSETSGPFIIDTGAVLYPPPMLILFVPFVFLGPLLWSLIPAAIMVAVIAYHRPALWGIALILGCVAFSPEVQTLYWFGTPTIWIAAFVALATVRSWPAALVILKPAVVPFVALAARDRQGWLALILAVLVSLVFLPMWLEWITVMLNASGPRANVLYALGDVPLLAIPLIAWLSGRYPPTWLAPRWPRPAPVMVEDSMGSQPD